MCLEVKAKLPYMATVLLHAFAKMVVGLPKAMSAIAFKPPSGARWRVLSEKEKGEL